MNKIQTYKIIRSQQIGATNELPADKAKTGKYGGEPTHAGFWLRFVKVAPLLGMPDPAYRILGYLSAQAEYTRPELNITIDRLAWIARTSKQRAKAGMRALRHANLVVPYENRYYADFTRPPKGGAHKPVKYDIKNLHIGWDLSGLNGVALWVALCEYCLKTRDAEAFKGFISRMRFKKMVITENGDYLIVLTSRFDDFISRFNADAISDRMSDIASDISGVSVIIIAQGDTQQAVLALVEAE